MTRRASAWVAVFVTAVMWQPAGAQSTAQLKQELDALKARVDAQQKEIDALKVQRPAGATLPPLDQIELTLAKTPMAGNAATRVVLVEVSDFECPFCGRHARQTAPQIEREYVETGKVRHAFLNFPLASHRNAFKAAEAGLCAADQGKFWELHARMFANQTQLAPALVPPLAAAAGLNAEQLRACVDSGRKRDQVSADQAMAQRAGVTATPTFFVGLLDPKTGAFTVTERIIGAKPYAAFKQALDAALARN